MPASGSLPMFILLPGPPAELKPMVEHSVMPLLEDLADEDISHLRVFRLVGIGESDLQELVDDSLHQVEGLEVAYCARVGEVDVRLVGSEVALKQRPVCAFWPGRMCWLLWGHPWRKRLCAIWRSRG